MTSSTDPVRAHPFYRAMYAGKREAATRLLREGSLPEPVLYACIKTEAWSWSSLYTCRFKRLKDLFPDIIRAHRAATQTACRTVQKQQELFYLDTLLLLGEEQGARALVEESSLFHEELGSSPAPQCPDSSFAFAFLKTCLQHGRFSWYPFNPHLHWDPLDDTGQTTSWVITALHRLPDREWSAFARYLRNPLHIAKHALLRLNPSLQKKEGSVFWKRWSALIPGGVTELLWHGMRHALKRDASPFSREPGLKSLLPPSPTHRSLAHDTPSPVEGGSPLIAPHLLAQKAPPAKKDWDPVHHEARLPLVLGSLVSMPLDRVREAYPAPTAEEACRLLYAVCVWGTGITPQKVTSPLPWCRWLVPLLSEEETRVLLQGDAYNPGLLEAYVGATLTPLYSSSRLFFENKHFSVMFEQLDAWWKALEETLSTTCTASLKHQALSRALDTSLLICCSKEAPFMHSLLKGAPEARFVALGETCGKAWWETPLCEQHLKRHQGILAWAIDRHKLGRMPCPTFSGLDEHYPKDVRTRTRSDLGKGIMESLQRRQVRDLLTDSLPCPPLTPTSPKRRRI